LMVDSQRVWNNVATQVPRDDNGEAIVEKFTRRAELLEAAKFRKREELVQAAQSGGRLLVSRDGVDDVVVATSTYLTELGTGLSAAWIAIDSVSF
jgi:hypothetical protein